jgi:glycosyltransferase involved in cell wall biosynthesis
MMLSMRVLLFNLATDIGDPILGFTTRWIGALARRVEFIYVITMRAGQVEAPGNVRVYSVGKEKGYSEFRRAIEFYRYLFRIFREDRIDVCFSHMIPIFAVMASPVLKAKNIPIVSWYAHRQVTTTLKLAHGLSNRMVSINESSYPYDHKKFSSLGHGIDTDFFSPEDLVPSRPPLLLSVGRLSPIKDLLTLIEALHLLRQQGLSFHCVLVGSPFERDRSFATDLHQKVRDLGLETLVEFVGDVAQDQVVHWYRRCLAHVNLCPNGALDKAALEAMACGKPSLVANRGFQTTIDKYAGDLIFRHGDAFDLKDRLVQLLEMPPLAREEMGRYLRQKVVDRHGLDHLTNNLMEILTSVTQNYGPDATRKYRVS